MLKLKLQQELNKNLQINLQQGFTSQVYISKLRVQMQRKVQPSLKQALKYNTVDNVDDKRRASHLAH